MNSARDTDKKKKKKKKNAKHETQSIIQTGLKSQVEFISKADKKLKMYKFEVTESKCHSALRNYKTTLQCPHLKIPHFAQFYQ